MTNRSISNYRIPLARDTISGEDLRALSAWLLTNPRLSKGSLCDDFEQAFAQWQGSDHAHFVNSGSSANLLAINALQVAGTLKPGDKVIAPAISWTTTVAPITQLNCEPVLCDADPDNLGLSVEHLAQLAESSGAKALILCHVLGIPNRMKEIVDICESFGLTLIEDCCEALGSQYDGERVGNFGALSTFSFYFGHQMSTIEGGMICAKSDEHSNIIRSLRSHGWNRDLDEPVVAQLRQRYDIDAFSDKYTFYHPGFNFRSTDLNAFLGLRQLARLSDSIAARERLWDQYQQRMSAALWRPEAPEASQGTRVSGFAWPMISPDRAALAATLDERGVEARPLLCGSIGRQPWFLERYGRVELEVADRIHEHGLYVPINPQLSDDELGEICSTCLDAVCGSIREPIVCSYD
jgi:CDP-6-deoxy-D-xylo-4-hexulose-3-dehydrase